MGRGMPDSLTDVARALSISPATLLAQIGNVETAHLATKTARGLITARTVQVDILWGSFKSNCPYCEGIAGEGDESDPWLPGYFLASNSTFTDPEGRQLGTVHVLKDITDRKRAEEKYCTLISNVQEGVFISTPAGRSEWASSRARDTGAPGGATSIHRAPGPIGTSRRVSNPSFS